MSPRACLFGSTMYVATSLSCVLLLSATTLGQQTPAACVPDADDCCSPSRSPGCRTASCCALVCACDSFCCDTIWDEGCATTGNGGNGCGAALLCAICNDSDGDGVADDRDLCCDTPVGTAVDDSGRPIGDLDHDCDVDLEDFALLQRNLGGALLAEGSCCTLSPSLCDDMDPCTIDSCDPLIGCVTSPAAPDSPCGDGNACNGDETCDGAGFCRPGSPAMCDDGSPCTVDSCDPIIGCVTSPQPAGTSCGDGEICNGDETCDDAGVCQPGIPPMCDDGNPCTIDRCDSIVGCLTSPAPSGTSCEDGNACNGDETCDGKSVCQPGMSPMCDDGNPCTINTCDPIIGCLTSPEASGTPCGDGNACNGDETCNAVGICQAGLPPKCDDGNPCTIDNCDSILGCMTSPQPSGASCGDGDACNGNEVCDGTGICQPGTDPMCDDGNPCTIDSCDPQIGCVTSPRPSGTSCGDGNACNGDETCDGAGICRLGQPPICGDGNPCTIDSCDPQVGCVALSEPEGTSCTDGNACNGDETCNGTGSCRTVPAGNNIVSLIGDEDNFGFFGNIANGLLFFNELGGSAFTDNREFSELTPPADKTDHWEVGGILATPWVHQYDLSFTPIHASLRLYVAGLADAAPADLFVEGVQLARFSFPGQSQTTHILDVDIPIGFIDGATEFQLVPDAADGFILDFMRLTIVGPIDCNDNNPCTSDSCDPLIGCVNAAESVGTPCADGDVCNGNETCDGAGGCQPGTPLDCDDGNQCTADSCDPINGCVHSEEFTGTGAISLIGDEDNFGFFGNIANGLLFFDDLDGSAFTDNRELSEMTPPADKTDHWEVGGILTAPWVHQYALPFTPVRASLRLYVAGLADGAPADLFVEGVKLATFSYPGQSQTTHILDVDVPIGFIDGATEFQLVPDATDGFILDFMKLTIVGPIDCDDNNPCTMDSCDPLIGCVHTDICPPATAAEP